MLYCRLQTVVPRAVFTLDVVLQTAYCCTACCVYTGCCIADCILLYCVLCLHWMLYCRLHTVVLRAVFTLDIVLQTGH